MKPKLTTGMLLLICNMMFAQTTSAGQTVPVNNKPQWEFHALNQVWLRYNESNPGTTVLGEAQPHTTDIGLRRTRFQAFGEVAPKVFLYFQLGQNNFNRMTNLNGNRKNSFFIHDAFCEYNVLGDRLKLGGGLTIANGLSRFSQPSVATILALDVPVFAQTTVDQTDQFSRKLSVVARGQLKRWDYRFVLSDPFPVQSNGAIPPAISSNATFALKTHRMQQQIMIGYDFFEKEPLITPYMAGTYLGMKKVLNVSAGAIYQPNATWYLVSDVNQMDTQYAPMKLACMEVFYDAPVNKEKGSALHLYLGFFSTNYGKNYIRYNGIMNPADGISVTGLAKDVGSQYGNAYPMFGTGKVLYGQQAYLLPKNFLGDLTAHGQLQLYASECISQYQRLGNQSNLNWSCGVNWLMPGNQSKITIDVSNRRAIQLYQSDLFANTRRSTFTIQYQINI
jgi:hypothetical protein